MRKIIASAALLGMLTSCGTITGVSKGTRTTNYDEEGKVISVTEDQAIGDPNTEYYGAVRAVATAASENLKARADAIKSATTPESGDSADAKAWKAAFASLAIATMEDRTAENIRAVTKATTGYDVANNAVSMIKETAVTGLPWYFAARAIKDGFQAAGDETTTQVNGDGNETHSEYSKTHQTTEIHANATDEASPTVTTSPQATGSPVTTETTEMLMPEEEAAEGEVAAE